MAISGLILAGFALSHMIGNLQMFSAPEKINLYAHFLQHLNPMALWGFRGFLLLCVAVHIWTGITLAIENRIARPEKYDVKATRVATLSAKTMPVTGIVLLGFIVFHIIHFTVKVCLMDYAKYKSVALENMHQKLFDVVDYPIFKGEGLHDVYNMVVDGFSVTWVAVFYIISMILLFTHLSHGCSSFFQTIGIRNEKWRYILNKLGILYALVVMLGFIAVPAGVLAGLIKNQPTESPRGQEVQAALVADSAPNPGSTVTK
jgi:succinate dehydrogenase / fumarate reductase cytochrome b subunit